MNSQELRRPVAVVAEVAVARSAILNEGFGNNPRARNALYMPATNRARRWLYEQRSPACRPDAGASGPMGLGR
jgi:hypothetical protein